MSELADATADQREEVLSILKEYKRRDLVTSLIVEYGAALDDRRIDDWPNFFAEEASYYVMPRDNYERGLPICLMYDDSRGRIEDRVAYIERVWKGHYNEYQARHIISDVRITPADDGDLKVRANFACYATDIVESITRLLAVGEYVDRIAFENGAPKFKEKKVILDTNVLPDVLVYPL